MKRRLTKLVVFLLLGAIVNVGVAWGCAIYFQVRETYPILMTFDRPRGPGVTSWLKGRENSVGMIWNWWTRQQEGLGVRETLFVETKMDRANVASHSSVDALFIEAGLPRYALCGGRIHLAYDPSFTVVFPRTDHGVISVGDFSPLLSLKRSRLLPLHLIWPGFAINTIFYATILWLPFAPFQLRRYVRGKRGHCIKCGYDLRGHSGGCPECGSGRADGTTNDD